MTPIPDKQSIAWLRLQAEAQGKIAAEALRKEQMYADMANEMEIVLQTTSKRDAVPAFVSIRTQAPNGAGQSEKRALTIEGLREYLKHKGGRSIHVARHFGVSTEEVERLINTTNSGVRVAERGWLKLALFH